MEPETQAESEFRKWLEAQPAPPPLPALRDLDARAAIKRKKIDAAKRKRNRLKAGEIPLKDVGSILFGHLD